MGLEVCKSLNYLVGPPRFELGTSCTPNRTSSNLFGPIFNYLHPKELPAAEQGLGKPWQLWGTLYLRFYLQYD
jgi:hypothetical protein